MKRKPSPAIIIASMALFFSLTGAGFAASHYLITSTSQIKPSVLRELHGARGPQGVPGQQGPTGATGSQGQQGMPSNLDGDYSSTGGADLCSEPVNTPQFSCDTSADVTVRCNPGDHAISGGFGGSNEIVSRSGLTGTTTGRGWNVVAHLDPSADSGSVQTFVLCAKG